MALVGKMPFFRPEHTRRQRILLILGWGLLFLLVMLLVSLWCIFTGDSSGFGYNAGIALYSSLNMVYQLLGWKEVFTV